MSPRAYVVPKYLLPLVERNLPAFQRGGMTHDERWTYEQVLTVVRGLETVNAVYLVPRLVYAVNRYTNYMPFIPCFWRFDLSTSSRESVSTDQGGMESVSS